MSLLRTILRFGRDVDGVGSIYMLCLLPLFLVLAGFGMDGTAAFRTRDMLQSTADAAALAGALQLPTGGSASTNQQCAAVNKALSYAQANMSVAGFGNVLHSFYTSPSVCTPGDVVFGDWNGTTFTSPAPVGKGNAVQVTVKTATANSNPYPTSFLALIGKSSWDIVATAIAMNGVPKPICLLSLSTAPPPPPGILSDGLPHSNLSDCTIASNSSMTCNGARSDGGAEFGISVGANSGCGKIEATGPVVSDSQYSSMLDNTTKSNALTFCGGTFNGINSGSLPPLTSSPLVVCGDLNMQGDLQLAPAAGGSLIIIENGQLATNGHNLTTSNSNGLTIIFSGTQASGSTHQVTGDGTLTYNGPPTGTWKNMAIYQDPALVSPADLDYVPRNPGQKIPNLDVSGIIYMPHATFELHGSAGNNNPNACIVIVANIIKIVGTGDVLAQQACTNAPTTLVPISRLVQ